MSKRKTILRVGVRGDTVRVVEDKNRDRYIVEYRDHVGAARRRFYPLTTEGKREARIWAAAYHAERDRQQRQGPRPAITLRHLWDAYTEATFGDLRAKSRISYGQRWKKWEEFLTASHRVDDTTLQHVDQFRAAARKTDMALNQIRAVLAVARIVYNWGQSRELVTNNKLALYRWKQPKDESPNEPAEYTEAEFDALLRQFDPSTFHGWRPWVVLMLAGHHGQRANAVLHLKWEDVLFDEGVILWPKGFQKQGKRIQHPILDATLSALIVAEQRRDGSEWVLPAARLKAKPYSYSSFHYQLTTAETAAGIEHKPYRALHGLRKMVVGSVTEASGDRMLGLEYVGDTDPKMLKHYDKRAQARIDRASELVGSNE